MKLSIIIPTYREAENLKILIPELIKKIKPYEILVVDDGSQDGTSEVLTELDKRYPEQEFYFIERHGTRGIGSAIAYGYDQARGDTLLSIDADLSMDLADVPKLLNKLKEGYEVVVGSRYIPGGLNRKEAVLPRIASIVGNLIFKFVFNLSIKDVSMNFRVLNKHTWEEIKTKESSNVMLLEMLVNANNIGARLAEVPTVFKERIHGETKTRIFKLTLLYLSYVCKYYLKGIGSIDNSAVTK